ncbi:MAG TPA: ABC transporter ATP-binding protein [Kineosporiaceae bacterium]|jgi:putative ABC transport system ATP-binding protein|nr:ABC transporter ATP-binding protein [Kineosporiaceae bacterium]
MSEQTQGRQGRHALERAPLLRARGLERTYRSGRREVRAVAGVDLDVPAGALTAVRGRSGSGKTTLLNLLSGLDRPDAGTVHLGDLEVSALSEHELVDLRRRRVGVVFQTFGLVPILTAAENVGVPLRLLGTPREEREARVAELLDAVGLTAHAKQRPTELSGGQQQRVAVARALANRPDLLVADEPTGQLDSATGRVIMALLLDLVHSEGLAAVVATHDPSLVGLADDVVDLRNGRIGEPVAPAV